MQNIPRCQGVLPLAGDWSLALPRRISCGFVAITPRCGGRLAYRTAAPYHVVKMRTFAPLLVFSLRSKTIAALSDFHSV